MRVSGQVDGGRLMVRTAARTAQDHTGGRNCERGGAVKYAWGELYGTAGAIGVERTGRDGIDGVLNGGSVVCSRWQEVDLCGNGGKRDAAGAVACERVVGNRGAVLIAAIYKMAIGTRMDPLALLREQRWSEEREQRWCEEQQGSGAKRFHANHYTSIPPIRRFLQNGVLSKVAERRANPRHFTQNETFQVHRKLNHRSGFVDQS